MGWEWIVIITLITLAVTAFVETVLIWVLFTAVGNWRRNHETLRADSIRMIGENARMIGIHQNILADFGTKMRQAGMTNIRPIPTMAEWQAAAAKDKAHDSGATG